MSTVVQIDGTITIYDPPEGLVKSVMRTLRLPNPTYHVAIRKNPRAKFALSEYIEYAGWNERCNKLIVPRAVLGRVVRWLEQNQVNYSTRDMQSNSDAPSLRSTIQLRDYQRDVLEPLRDNRNGIFHLSTGFGKTLLALKLAETIKKKTLIIVPKLDLLNQFVEEYNKYFDGECGVIQGKKENIQDITVATVQTLRNRLDSGGINPDAFGCVIIDECHLFVTEKSRQVIEHFSAKYRYGFTGTMGRSDGQIDAIEWIIGPVIMKRQIERATPVIEIKEYSNKIFMDEYHEIINSQTEHEERNQLIYDIAKEKERDGRRVLILTKRVRHAEEIAKGEECYIFRSTNNKVERDSYLKAAKDNPNSVRILIGTYGLLGTGIDIPGLDTLILAGDLKSEVLLEQSAGRILRLFDDKAHPIIVDIYDSGNPILKRQGKSRQRFYKENGWDMIIGG